MTDKIKYIINRIGTSSVVDIQTLGYYISNELCKEDEMAIYIGANNMAVLLVPYNNNYDANCREAFYYLIELIAVIEKLEREGLIYLLADTSQEEGYLIFEHNRYTYTNQAGHGAVLKNNNEIKMQGITLIPSVSEKVSRYLNSFVFPTQGLKDYIKHGYMTEEETITYDALKQSKSSVRVSRWAVFISLLIAVGSIIGTTYFNNKYGYSTIDKDQYDNIIMQIQSCKKCETDTINSVTQKEQNVKPLNNTKK